ncbi:MAG TPA: type IV pilin protein [Steroidobacteraceae bacterium]|nr:type IV pilin protein [Steroidobacteraceae bacterium]
MKTAAAMAPRMRGVTLVELLTVVTVVGILSAIAIPSYTNYVVRVTRTDAKRGLLDYSSRLERCYTRGNDYTLKEAASTDPCVTLPETNAEKTYTFTGDIVQNKYTLTATPINGQTRDTKCKAFTLTQAGEQNVTGPSGPHKCWEGRD